MLRTKNNYRGIGPRFLLGGRAFGSGLGGAVLGVDFGGTAGRVFFAGGLSFGVDFGGGFGREPSVHG